MIGQKTEVAPSIQRITQPETKDNTERTRLQEQMWQTLQDRMVTTYSASRQSTTDNSRMEAHMFVVGEQARLYFRYHIPLWPLKMLIRKIVRRLVFPLLHPQTLFNEAARDALAELRQRSDRQEVALQQATTTIVELEHQVTLLTGQVETLLQRISETRTEDRQTNGLSSNGTITLGQIRQGEEKA